MCNLGFVGTLSGMGGPKKCIGKCELVHGRWSQRMLPLSVAETDHAATQQR